MLAVVKPIAFALFVWWFSTGLIIWLDGLPRKTFKWSMIGATVVLALSLYGLRESASMTSPAGAYYAFTCGLLAWGWQEISFIWAMSPGLEKRLAQRDAGASNILSTLSKQAYGMNFQLSFFHCL